MKILTKKRNAKKGKVSTKLKAVDTFVIVATNWTSVTLWITRFGLVVKPISNENACGLTLPYKVLYEFITN